MFYRNLLPDLEKHLENKLITVVVGLRRVGKTSIIKALLAKVNSENKLFLDFEKAENRFIFSQKNYSDIETSLRFLGLDLTQKAYLALDEIQLVANSTSVIKYLYDTYDIKFLVTGSSSFYLKNHFTESLAGRKRIFEMHPLSFSEFLDFKESGMKLDGFLMQKFNSAIYAKLNELYREYLIFGGFPEVVLESNKQDKIEYLKEIINAYLQMDLLIAGDIQRTDEIYSLLRLLNMRVGSKIDYNKIASVSGLSRQKVKEYLTFLEYTFFIHQIAPYSKSPDKEISLQKKLYYADNGLLTVFGVTDMGKLLENSITNQLVPLGKLNYYAKKNGQEIDFILNEKLAIEVKETATEQDLKTLVHRAESIGMVDVKLVGLNQTPSEFSEYIWAGLVG